MTPDVYRHAFENLPDDALKFFFGLNADEELQQKKNTWVNGLTTFNKSFLYFQLLKKDTEENIGWCGFHTWYIQHHRAEIGYVLTNTSERGNGYMKEAITEIVKYGFEKMNLHRIEAFIEPNNTASLKLAQHLGFVKEGYLREHYLKNGKMEDSVVFSLLKTEFNPIEITPHL